MKYYATIEKNGFDLEVLIRIFIKQHKFFYE